jgi:hypothetical protein
VLGMVMKSDGVQSVGETPRIVGSIGGDDVDVGNGDLKVGAVEVVGADDDTCFVN